MLLENNKAINLTKLRNIDQKNFSVPEFIYFSKKDFIYRSDELIKKIRCLFKSPIIIRSATYDEDSVQVNAGKYTSFELRNLSNDNIYHAIKEVISKFKKKKDIFIVQKLISNVQNSGVIFSKELKTQKDYIVINYDRSRKTNLITSGVYNPTVKAVYIRRESDNIPVKFKKIISTLKKLESIFNSNQLDIEYCIKKNHLFLFQIRKLPKVKIKNSLPQESTVTNIKKKIKHIINSKHNIHGNKTFLSNMADWNPVEILGSKPSKLAISLYKEFITNEIWAIQRKNYGYKDITPNSLMYDIYGIPYIDVRIDLNSFLPANLSDSISSKIINNSLKKIEKTPSLHNKIEFELAPSFITDYSDDIRRILSRREFIHYKKVTNSITVNLIQKNICDYEMNKIKSFLEKINLIKHNNYPPITKIFYYNYYIKKYGTLPFAGLARCAFISKYICDVLIDKKVICKSSIKEFYSSFNNITTNIHDDYAKYVKKKISKKAFVSIYGHLRPSTYDITCLSYKEGFKNYFNTRNFHIIKKNNFKFTNLETKKINDFFKKHNFNISANQFIDFCRKSTELREKSKFEFTKGIDLIFSELKKLFNEMNIDEKYIQYVDLSLFLQAHSSLKTVKLRDIIKKEIVKSINEKKEADTIIFPEFIKSENDIDFFFRSSEEGTYYGNKNIYGEILIYSSKKKQNFRNKIIVIENADPGYDFLFTNNIMGLITKNGGPNSHMAIRCSELNITSIIGIGEEVFNNIINQRNIMIDPNNNLYKLI